MIIMKKENVIIIENEMKWRKYENNNENNVMKILMCNNNK